MSGRTVFIGVWFSRSRWSGFGDDKGNSSGSSKWEESHTDKKAKEEAHQVIICKGKQSVIKWLWFFNLWLWCLSIWELWSIILWLLSAVPVWKQSGRRVQTIWCTLCGCESQFPYSLKSWLWSLCAENRQKRGSYLIRWLQSTDWNEAAFIKCLHLNRHRFAYASCPGWSQTTL